MKVFKKNNDLVVVILFVTTFILYFPLDIYLNNYNEFSVPFVHLLIILFSIFFLFTGFCYLSLYLLKKFSIYFYKIILFFLIIFSILAWVYGSLINWNYGLFDGSPVKWNEFSNRNIIDIGVMLLIFLIFFLIFKHKNGVKNVCSILILIEVMFIGYTFLKIDIRQIDQSWKNYKIINDNIAKFSKTKNYVVLVLDSFQTDIFTEMLDKGILSKDSYQGFNLYRNNLGGFPRTYAAVPLILTGEYYDNSQPIQSFIKDAFENSSVFIPLKKKGFRNEVYPISEKTIYLSPQIDNIEKKGIFDNNDVIKKLLITSLYKSSPTFIKKLIYNFSDVEEISLKEGGDKKKLVNLKENIEFTYEVPVFKYIHLQGVHEPLKFDKYFEFQKNLEFNRDNVISQARAFLNMIDDILFIFKKNNMYENLFFAVIGDHGNSLLEFNGFGKEDYLYSEIEDSWISAATPLLLVKNTNNNSLKKLNILDDPISQKDFKDLVINDLLGQKYIQSSDTTRKFYKFDWTDKYWFWQNDYLSDLVEYEVRGHVWNRLSWFRTGVEFTQNGKYNRMENIDEYQIGEIINFGKNKVSSNYLLGGWSWEEDNYVMADQKVASLKIPLKDEITDNIILELGFSELYIPKGMNGQRMQIWLENNVIEELTLSPDNYKKVSVFINKKNILNKKLLRLSLIFPDAISPLYDENGTDSRVRSVGIRYVKFGLYR